MFHYQQWVTKLVRLLKSSKNQISKCNFVNQMENTFLRCHFRFFFNNAVNFIKFLKICQKCPVPLYRYRSLSDRAQLVAIQLFRSHRSLLKLGRWIVSGEPCLTLMTYFCNDDLALWFWSSRWPSYVEQCPVSIKESSWLLFLPCHHNRH